MFDQKTGDIHQMQAHQQIEKPQYEWMNMQGLHTVPVR